MLLLETQDGVAAARCKRDSSDDGDAEACRSFGEHRCASPSHGTASVCVAVRVGPGFPAAPELPVPRALVPPCPLPPPLPAAPAVPSVNVVDVSVGAVIE